MARLIKWAAITGVAAVGITYAAARVMEHTVMRGKVIGPAPKHIDALAGELRGKSFLIVGGTKGIGAATAKSLAVRGAKVTVVGRSEDPALKELGVAHVKADLSSLATAQRVARELDVGPLEAVLFTTGVLAPPTRTLTPEGIEVDTAVSYLSRYVMAQELARNDKLGASRSDKSQPVRIFVMGYPGSNQGAGQFDDLNWEHTPYNPWPCHMNTVIGNEALVILLSTRYPSVASYGLNPGIIQTDIRANLLSTSWAYPYIESLIGALFMSADDYAENTVIQLLASRELPPSGALFNPWGEVIQGASWVSEPANREKVWTASEKLVATVLPTDKRT